MQRLYTIQPQDVWEKLQTNGVVRVDSWMTDSDFAEAYHWLKLQMRKRIYGYSGGDLFWAWVEKPPYEEYFMGGKFGQPLVCLEVEISSDRVLLSDYESWHFVLMNSYLSRSEKEFDNFARRKMSSDLRKEISKSWEKIFGVNRTQGGSGWLSEEVLLQATFEYLKRSDVRNVEYFEAHVM